MTNLQRQEQLHAFLEECLDQEPKLSLAEIAEVVAWSVPDLTEFLKAYAKALKTQI